MKNTKDESGSLRGEAGEIADVDVLKKLRIVIRAAQLHSAWIEKQCGVSGAPGALYVGDDVIDEDVFRLGRNDVLTVRIERAGNSTAEFHLNHRLEMVQLFDELIGRLSAAHSAAISR